MRNPEAEYQYGKRNLSMIKYKKSTDGKFTIVDIYPEGVKRKDVPLFLLRNDINDETFEVHLGGSFSYQKYVLDNKEDFIGKETLSGNSDEAVRMFICNQYSMSYAVNRETGEVILERKGKV